MSSYALNQGKMLLSDKGYRIPGTCPGCSQAIWNVITGTPRALDTADQKTLERYKSLPPAYIELQSGENSETDVYLICFCQVFHRFINWMPEYCDGNIPGEKMELQDFLDQNASS